MEKTVFKEFFAERKKNILNKKLEKYNFSEREEKPRSPEKKAWLLKRKKARNGYEIGEI